MDILTKGCLIVGPVGEEPFGICEIMDLENDFVRIRDKFFDNLDSTTSLVHKVPWNKVLLLEPPKNYKIGDRILALWDSHWDNQNTPPNSWTTTYYYADIISKNKLSARGSAINITISYLTEPYNTRVVREVGLLFCASSQTNIEEKHPNLPLISRSISSISNSPYRISSPHVYNKTSTGLLGLSFKRKHDSPGKKIKKIKHTDKIIKKVNVQNVQNIIPISHLPPPPPRKPTAIDGIEEEKPKISQPTPQPNINKKPKIYIKKPYIKPDSYHISHSTINKFYHINNDIQRTISELSLQDQKNNIESDIPEYCYFKSNLNTYHIVNKSKFLESKQIQIAPYIL